MTTDRPQNPAPPLIAYVESVLGKLLQHLTGAVTQAAVVDVHQARVATRRLKAALTLFEPVLSSDAREALARTTKRLRRRLGPLRDHDVMIGHLRSMRRRRSAAAIAFLTTELERAREELTRELADSLNLTKVLIKLQGQWEAARREMMEAEAAIPSLLRDTLLPQLEDFSQRATALARMAATHSASTESPERGDGPAAGSVAGAGHFSEDPHELRIAGKALRYTLEMYGESAPERPLDKSVLSTFKKMQEHLGTWHDSVVLAETAMRVSLEHHLPLHRPALQREVLDLSQELLKRAERAFGQFAALWREEGPAIHDAIAGLFPVKTHEPGGAHAPDVPKTPEPRRAG